MEGVSSALKKAMESEEQSKKCYKHRPPDGGWGWVIVIAYAIQNMILLPILINFGLMFRGVFTELKMTTTDSSIIINVNSAAGLLFGLLNGPLLKTYGFRKIACVGALLTFFGNSMTSFATSLFEFILYYGIISSIGVALVMSSFSLALNTYFLERRGVATGLAMSATGLGPIFVPLVISQLMSSYGGRGTSLIMAALTLHSFAGALLLQPVKWHYRKMDEENDAGSNTANGSGDKHAVIVNEEGELTARRRFSDVMPLRGATETTSSMHSLNIPKDGTPKARATDDIINCANVKETEKNAENNKYKTYNVNDAERSETEAFIRDKNKEYHEVEKDDPENNVKRAKTWQQRIVKMFDLDLLQEPVFINIWVGMAIAFTAEMNFTLMTPFILGDMGYDTKETAKIMSIMGISDILTRLICPFIGSRTKLPARYLYLLSLLILIAFRFCLTVVTSHLQLVGVFIGLGVGRGFLSVYRALVVPNHVPLEKLPSASGLTTVLNGICLLSFGPVLGYIRDKIGNYDWYIYVLNILSIITIIMWSTEFLRRIFKYRKQER